MPARRRFIVTPALEISNAWRAAAIPVGMVLMAVVAALRLAQLSAALTPIAAAVGADRRR